LVRNILKKIGKDENVEKIKIDELKDFLSISTKKSVGKKYLTLIINHLGNGASMSPEIL